MNDENPAPKSNASRQNAMALDAQSHLDRQLLDAATRSNASLISDCLARGANPLAADADGYTALMWAARFDLAKNAQILLPVSDLEQRCEDGRTAIEVARMGAGVDSRAARVIESYMLAQKELAILSQSAAVAAKKTPRRYGL